jgi:ribonuclease J
MAEAGMVIVAVGLDRAGGVTAGPEILARGFAHQGEEADALFAEVRRLILEAIRGSRLEERRDRALVQQKMRGVVRRVIQKAVDRRPAVVPIVLNTQDAGRWTLDA